MRTAVSTDPSVTALRDLSREFTTKKFTVQTRILLKVKGVHLITIPGQQSELGLSEENWDQLTHGALIAENSNCEDVHFSSK